MTGWCFAIVNNRLAEIYFERVRNSNPEILGYCYVRKEDFRTKTEQRQIAKDSEHLKIIYRKKKYYRKTDKGLELIPSGKLPDRVKKADEAVRTGKTRTFAEVKKKLGLP